MDVLNAGLLAGPPVAIGLFIPTVQVLLSPYPQNCSPLGFLFTMKKEAVVSSEMLVPICYTIRFQIKSNCILYLQRFITCCVIINYYSKFYNIDAV
jgi:hypothetical protein